MSADLEYNEYFLTDEGWIPGNSKYAGDKVCHADLPKDIETRSYMKIKIFSEGKMSAGVKTWTTSYKKEGCDEKIKELQKKYPQPEM